MKVLVIGFGSIGKRHYNILSNFVKIENIYLVSRRNININNSFSSLDNVENIEQFDYFVISSKTVEHYNELIFINSKVRDKIILVEKPLFEVIKPDIPINNKIFIAYNLRFHPLIQRTKDILENKKVLSARFYAGQYLPTWRPNTNYKDSYSAKKEEGGGILLDYSHDIDLINYLFGNISEIESFNSKISNLDISSDDYLSMIGVTKNNIHFTLSLDSISKIQKREIQINLENMTLFIDLINNILYIKEINKEIEIIEIKEYDRNTSFENMHKLILKVNTKDIATFNDGLLLSEVFEYIRNNSNKKDW